MKRKIEASIFALVALIAIVGFSIHFLHENAMADTSYTVDIWYWEGPDQQWEEPLTNEDVEMNFKENGQWSGWIDATEVEDGRYKVTRQNSCDEWKVYINNSNVTPISPDSNPCSDTGATLQFDWEVIP